MAGGMDGIAGFLLIDEFELTLDEKNRLLIPSDVRRQLVPERDGDGLILLIGRNNKPWLYPERYYQALVSRMEQEIAPDEDALAFDQMMFARASRLVPDKQGRVVMPEKTLRRSGLKGPEVTLIGVRDHLELWSREEWAAYDAELTARQNEILLRAKQARTGTTA